MANEVIDSELIVLSVAASVASMSCLGGNEANCYATQTQTSFLDTSNQKICHNYVGHLSIIIIVKMTHRIMRAYALSSLG